MTITTAPTVENDGLSELEAQEPIPWLPRGCPVWCDARHHVADHREDRNHFGQELNTPLSLNRLVEITIGMGETMWQEETVRTYLQQHVEWSAPIVQVEREDSSVLELTLDEARCLAANLLTVCGEAS